MICIYKITNIFTGQFYIGSTVNFTRRKGHHLWQLSSNKHYNNKLQNIYNKYGKDCFLFNVIEEVKEKKYLKIREQFFIDTLYPCLNIRKDAQNSLEYSGDVKYRMSIWQKGKVFSKDTLQKMSIAQSGKTIPIITRENISKGLKKYFAENGSPNKGKVGNRLGVKLTKEQIEKRTATRILNGNGKY